MAYLRGPRHGVVLAPTEDIDATHGHINLLNGQDRLRSSGILCVPHKHLSLSKVLLLQIVAHNGNKLKS